jgi:beta-xylosidase
MKQNQLFILLLLLIPFAGLAQPEKLSVFKPGEIWPDEQGVHINAHGGGFLYHNGTYYWYGEHKTEGPGGNRANVGVQVYSSTDLYNWKNEGVALAVSDDPESLIVKGCVIERPKVIFNPKTKKFVMWFHHELKGMGYTAAKTGVAISNSATGPFEYLESMNPNPGKWPQNFTEEQKNSKFPDDIKAWSPEWVQAVKDGMFVVRDFDKGQMARDMTLFVDDNGKAYHIYASEENLTLHIAELNDEYTGFTGKYVRILPAGHNEAPAIIKRNGKYIMITSGCTGWDPNPARSAVADNIFGPWAELGNPCIGEGAEITFDSQSTYILPVKGKDDFYIFMGDRWRPRNAIDGRYVWLPLEFDGDRPILKWYDEWRIPE